MTAERFLVIVIILLILFGVVGLLTEEASPSNQTMFVEAK